MLGEVTPPREFRLSPTPAIVSVGWVCLAIHVAIAVAMVIARAPAHALGVAMPVLLGSTGLIMWLVFFGPRGTRVVVTDELEILPRPYGRRVVRRGEIRSMRIADWEREPDLGPWLRVGGTSLGSYHVGAYRLRNKKRALVMTASTRVLCIETDERTFLLAPDRFDAFVAAVEATIGPVQRAER